jgi:integrase/recombinase XerD
MPTKLSVVKSKPTNALARSVDDYLASVRARGLSPRTTRHYEAVLRSVFLPILAENDVTTPQAITQRVLDRLSTQLLEEGGARGQLSRHSVHSYVGTISHYIAWARRDGEITSSVKPQRVRLPHRVLNVLSREEIRAIEDVATTERDKLIVRVLADTGLRLSELLGLTAADLVEQGRDRYVKVKGKGARERLVPLQPSLYMRLRRFAERGRPHDATSERIFVTLRHSRISGAYEPLEPRAVQELMSTLAEKAGVQGKPTNPHSLRHAFATWCLRRGMNPIQLQRILGHSSLEMISNVYGHLAPTDAAAALMAVLRSDE